VEPPPVAVKPTPISRPPPAFPLGAPRGVNSGSVRARLTINAAGAVTDVAILSAQPAQVFNRAATEALQNWKFNPGAGERKYEVEIEFQR
jgi:TonB family protein